MEANDERIVLRSEHVQELLNAVPNRIIRYGNLLIFSFILLLIGLSWFIKYPDIIASQAIVTTSFPPQKNIARITGKIDTLFIKENQSVQENEVIALLENTANFHHIKLLGSIIDTIKPNNKTFSFPINELPILFLGEIDSEYALFENSYIEYQINKTHQPISNEQLGNNFSIQQLYSRLNTLRSQKNINKAELEYQRNDLERQRQLYDKGVIAKQILETSELAFLQAQRNYANMDASISQLVESINAAKTNKRSTQIKKSKEEIRLLKNVLQSFNQLKRALQEWNTKYTLRSDIDGKVAFSKTWAAHQNVSQGELMFTIIPEKNSRFIGKLKTPSQNFGKIKHHQKVIIKLENYPENEFGTIEGEVESIPILPDENGFYNISVSLPSNLITSYNKKIEFKHEMRASAEIITEDLRLIDRLFYQLRNLFK
ncbi:HlyD family secretion protein [Winogradskyella tangerina]|uniref:HlyD family secretion protein n=1 Tax=Winogradskyella tangerina TaxID=2023240 RepID=UPI000DBE8B96|nr:HlyD family efflux transporter periplasmic adaptor subunit [Winogradskyella tangerina]